MSRQGLSAPGEGWALLTTVARAASAVARELDPGRVVQVIADEAMALGPSVVNVFVVDEEQRALRLAAHRNLPADLAERLARVSLNSTLLAARAVRSRTVQVVEDASQLPDDLSLARELLERTTSRSLVSAPLVTQERAVGALTWAFAEVGHFSAEELQAVCAMSEVFALGLVNAQAHLAARRLHAQVDAVRKAALVIGTPRNLRMVLQRIADQARALTGARYAALGFVEEPGVPFHPWVQSGVGEAEVQAVGRHPRPVGVLGEVALWGRTLRLRDLAADPRFRGFPPGHPPMRSFLGVPIAIQGRPLGNLYLCDKEGAEDFTSEDQHAVEVLAQHAAVALDHARTYERLLHEIAERERTEAALRESERRLRAIFDHAFQFIGLLSVDGTVLEANRAALEFAGHTKEEVIGRPFWEGRWWTVHPEPERIRAAVAEAAQGKFVRYESQHRGKDGRMITVDFSLSPVRDGSGRVVLLVPEGRDITERKEAERMRAQQAERLATTGTLAEGLAHEIKNPLNSAMLQLALLERRVERASPEVASQIAPIVATVRTELGRLTTLLADLLDLARARPLNLASCDLGELVAEVARAFAAEAERRGVRVEVHRPADLPHVQADAERMRQVFSAMAQNALDAMEQAGGVLRLRARAAEDAVEVDVEDTGPGIAPSAPVFDAFYTTKDKGTGLGLAVAYRIVIEHGGFVRVESRPGRTAFTVSLPR